MQAYIGLFQFVAKYHERFITISTGCHMSLEVEREI